MCFLPVCGLPLASYGNRIVPASFLITLPWTFPLKKQPFPPQQNPNPNSIYIQVIFWPLLCPVGLCFHLRGHVKLSWLLRLFKILQSARVCLPSSSIKVALDLVFPHRIHNQFPSPCLPSRGRMAPVSLGFFVTHPSRMVSG